MAKFDGTEGAVIELSQAISWTGNYRRDARPNDNNVVVKGHFYGREILQKLLDQEGSMGIRIYYAKNERGQKQLVLVAADADGNDMEETVVDSSKICPPDCSSDGSLGG